MSPGSVWKNFDGKQMSSRECPTEPAFKPTSSTSTSTRGVTSYTTPRQTQAASPALQANHLLTTPANSSLHQNAAAAPTTGALITAIVPTILDNAKYHMNP